MPLAAQRHIPATYAITGARIVPVIGPVIDKGTIVIRDGIIAAVGPDVTAPADARLVDGTGLSVYPGLIDAYTSLGQAAPAAATAAAGRGGRGAAATTPAARVAAPNSNHVTGLQPEINVVDAFNIEPGAFDAAHGAGVTSALTALAGGVFRGQSALIMLDGDSASQLVLRTGVSQNLGFSRGGGGGFGGGGGRGGYPGTLFGAMASLRQELLDAQHYHDVKAAYDRNPRSGRRPDFDASLEALQPVLARQQPVIFQANTEREIIRALDIFKEFNLRGMIAGGAEAYKVSARLKAENVPVLLTLNFPKAGATAGGGRGNAVEPGDPEPLRMLRDRVMAPKSPGMLAHDGVTFAFESGADYTDMIANMRKAVTAGLPAEAALKAATMQPAELFGVSDRLGSIEKGKIANLTITKGDLFDAASRVSEVFVDGVPSMVVAAAAPASGAGGRGGRGAPGVDASGAWVMSVVIDHHNYDLTLHVTQDQGRIYGSVQGVLGASEILNGEIADDGTFYFTATLSLFNSDEFEFDGTVDAKGIRGQVASEDYAGAFAGSHSN
jgi:imidazolonepropionase-like amidohydrolase